MLNAQLCARSAAVVRARSFGRYMTPSATCRDSSRSTYASRSVSTGSMCDSATRLKIASARFSTSSCIP